MSGAQWLSLALYTALASAVAAAWVLSVIDGRAITWRGERFEANEEASNGDDQ